MSKSNPPISPPLSNSTTDANAAQDEAVTPEVALEAAPVPPPQHLPDAVVPVAPLFSPEVMVAIVSALQGVPHIVASLQALTQAVQQVLPQVQAALVVAQTPAAPAAAPTQPAPPTPAKQDDSDDDWNTPRMLNMPPLPPPRSGGMNPFGPRGGSRNFARLNRIIQKGSWEEIEAEYLRSTGSAMTHEVRTRIARIRQQMGMSGPPNTEVTWPLPESTRAVPFQLTPEMLLAPLRADLARQGKLSTEPMEEPSEANSDPGESAKDEAAAEQPKPRRKPPSDMN